MSNEQPNQNNLTPEKQKEAAEKIAEYAEAKQQNVDSPPDPAKQAAIEQKRQEIIATYGIDPENPEKKDKKVKTVFKGVKKEPGIIKKGAKGILGLGAFGGGAFAGIWAWGVSYIMREFGVEGKGGGGGSKKSSGGGGHGGH